MLRSLARHWPEYCIEAAGLGLIMIAVCGFAMLLFHPDSLVARAIESVVVRRVLMGLAMGSTIVSLVYSPWGKQSGAHFNPAVTLTFFRLGRVTGPDALWYAISHVAGALAGMGAMLLLFGGRLSHPAVHFVTTMPGAAGAGVTWLAEVVMSSFFMTVLLTASNSPKLARWTGVLLGLVTVANVSLIVPLFGTSLNPARTLASAVPAQNWMSIWVYLTAAPAGMLAAAALYLRRHGAQAVFCAKLHHQNNRRCIFCQARAEAEVAANHRFLEAENVAAMRNPSSAAASNRTTSADNIAKDSEVPSAGRQEQPACPPKATTT